MEKCLKIRFIDNNKIGEVDYNASIKRGDFLVIETEKGEEIVKVLGASKDINVSPKFPIKRLATKKDLQELEENTKKEEEAKKKAKELIKKHNLDMHIIRAYIPLDKSKIFFYYTSESRVDFRSLVKDLAKALKLRIEMRQIGARDRAQCVGCVGLCGNVCCCHNFTEKFDSITMENIDYQNLPPSPSKFTGPCGKLICCMSYEKENYKIKDIFGPIGTNICINNKEMTIVHIDPISSKILLSSENEKLELNISELAPFIPQKRCCKNK